MPESNDSISVPPANGWLVPEGFRISAVSAGIARGDRPDLVLVTAEEACPAAAVFTTNRVIAAPVALCREHMQRNAALVRAILVNSGCANACTGPQGDQDALQCATWVADRLGCPPEQVLVFSTGVIGERLPIDQIEKSLDPLFEGLSRDSATVETVARAILTTDLVPKLGQRRVQLDTGSENPDGRVLGLAKGSGMIQPDMATMLAFLLTDVTCPLTLDLILRSVVGESFHHVSVDGDGSPNDSVLLWSSRRKEITEERAFVEALDAVASDLAKAIARDGEGATKLVEVRVTGAISPRQALACARSIANSLLVKTAVHGEDPNWGRILAAAGRSGAEINTRRVRVGVGTACLFEEDEPRPENEAEAAEHLEGNEVLLWIDLAAGASELSFYTCDLSKEYIRINADYRT